jgi:hypothetical protein
LGLLTVLSLAILLPAPASAQVPALSRGSLIIGGTASLTVDDDDKREDSITTVRVAPSLAYFAAPGLAVGGDVEIVHGSSGDVSSTSLGVGPAITYYFGREGDAHPFVRAGARYVRTDASFGTEDFTATQTAVHGGVGALFLLSDAVGVDVSLYYEHMRTKQEAAAAFGHDTYGLAVGVSVFLF